MMPAACALMQAPSTALSVDATPASTNGVASAATQVVHAFATSAHGETAAVKLCAAVIGHVTGGGEGGDGEGGGGGDGFGHALSAESDAVLTPAAMMPAACALMQAPSTALSVDATPASTNGVASAATQVVHALAVLLQGVTAAEKSCCTVTGHVTGGGKGGAGDGGGGGDGLGQAASALSDAALTPTAKM
jgi:hypothetical protein